MHAALATMTASESEGEQKKLEPMIMLRSASPSAAAPKAGAGLPSGVGTTRPSLFRPIAATSSTAWVRLGSAWPCEGESCPPKSSSGVALISAEGGAPKQSMKTALAYGPCTPLMLS